MTNQRVHSSIEAAARAMVTGTDPDFEAWLRQGFKAGFVGPPVCSTHDGTPLSEVEEEEFEEGDPCLHILRLYENAEQKAAVEKNHSPSVWRASNQGMVG